MCHAQEFPWQLLLVVSFPFVWGSRWTAEDNAIRGAECHPLLLGEAIEAMGTVTRCVHGHVAQFAVHLKGAVCAGV